MLLCTSCGEGRSPHPCGLLCERRVRLLVETIERLRVAAPRAFSDRLEDRFESGIKRASEQSELRPEGAWSTRSRCSETRSVGLQRETLASLLSARPLQKLLDSLSRESDPHQHVAESDLGPDPSSGSARGIRLESHEFLRCPRGPGNLGGASRVHCGLLAFNTIVSEDCDDTVSRARIAAPGVRKARMSCVSAAIRGARHHAISLTRSALPPGSMIRPAACCVCCLR